jgi:UDP-glucose 4-epimerase
MVPMLFSIFLSLLIGLSFSASSQAAQRPKVLVVGGAGYIGSTTAAALIDAGYEVSILDDLSTGHRELVLAHLTVARAADLQEVSQLLNREHFDAVLYFAAKSQVAESVKVPGLYWENNFDQTKIFLEMMLNAGTKNFIFSSTAATYGNPIMDYISELHPQNPINPYGETKLAVEKHLQKLALERGLRASALRYFNAAGTEPQLRVGERHEPETHLIPNVLKAIRTGEPIHVFGTDYQTVDGTAVRDYIHVTDLAHAHILAMEWLIQKGTQSSSGIFEAFNLGSKNGFSVKQVIQAAEKVTGRKVPFIEAPRRAGDPPRLVADSTKAREILGFETLAAGQGASETQYLEYIIQTAWKWDARAEVIWKVKTCGRLF